MVKVGIALSGCDIGAVSAYDVLCGLMENGVEIHALSVCCLPSVAALPYVAGMKREAYKKRAEAFLEEVPQNGMDIAIENYSNGITVEKNTKLPLAISAVNVSDGKTVAFTNIFSMQSANLLTFGLDNPYDVFKSTISHIGGCGGYQCRDCRLCDYCSWYGCPFFPLKIAGAQKIISISFMPELPETPYEALVRQRIAKSASEADIHIPIEFAARSAGFDEYSEIATGEIKRRIDEIYWNTLF